MPTMAAMTSFGLVLVLAALAAANQPTLKTEDGCACVLNLCRGLRTRARGPYALVLFCVCPRSNTPVRFKRPARPGGRSACVTRCASTHCHDWKQAHRAFLQHAMPRLLLARCLPFSLFAFVCIVISRHVYITTGESTQNVTDLLSREDAGPLFKDQVRR